MHINSISLSSIYKESALFHSASQKVIFAITAIAAIALLIFAAIYTIARLFNFKAHQVPPKEQINSSVPEQPDKTAPPEEDKNNILETKNEMAPPVSGQLTHHATVKEDQKKTVASKNIDMAPPGFENYGNSCWFASGLQILLANPCFEQVVRGPLKTVTVDRKIRGVFSYRDLTSEELEKRKNIRNALIELLDQRGERKPKEIKEVFINLHKTILANNPLAESFPEQGSQADCNAALFCLSETFGFQDLILRDFNLLTFLNPSILKLLENLPDEKNEEEIENWFDRLDKNDDFFAFLNLTDHKNTFNLNPQRKKRFSKTVLERLKTNLKALEPIKTRFEEIDNMPNLLVFVNLPKVEYQLNYDVNAHIDLSKYAKNGKKAIYRIVGVAHQVPGHWYSFVKKQEQWYCCNDANVLLWKEKITLNADDHVVLERIA